jgi:hypothetical protein
MRRFISRFAELFAILGVLGFDATAHAQACCAGASAITPGRLVMHDQALVGAQLRSSLVLGSFDGQGSYANNAKGSSDVEFEEDLFAALRVFDEGQIAVLVPFLQARREDRSGSEFGGGIGDLAINARYDFYAAGRSLYVPGIALVAGVTLPTGVAPENAKRLGTNATGLGVLAGGAGIALEQTYGDWFFTLIGQVAFRADRTVKNVGKTALAPQWSGLAGIAYAFHDGSSLGLSVQYSAEGDATIDGVTQPESARRRTLLSLAGLYPLHDDWSLRGYLLWDPPIGSLGANQLQNTGFGVNVIKAWR